MGDELKPCPFCGGTVLRTGGDDKVVGVSCLRCEASGPNHYGKYEWDDRAAPPASDLREENARLRKALEFYACDLVSCDCETGKEDKDNVSCGYRARAALNPEGLSDA
jgi:hypothetical protein